MKLKRFKTKEDSKYSTYLLFQRRFYTTPRLFWAVTACICVFDFMLLVKSLDLAFAALPFITLIVFLEKVVANAFGVSFDPLMFWTWDFVGYYETLEDALVKIEELRRENPDDSITYWD